ncbi:MAG: hypothetical protein WAT70_06775 [Rhizobiaceae bacterium]
MSPERIALFGQLRPGIVTDIADVDVRLAPTIHPYATRHAEAIAENWRAETGRNPRLFDGTVMLHSALSCDDAVLTGQSHPVPFSAFMHWRANRGVDGVAHLFAHAVPVGACGRLVAIRMAGHTANAGQVYFAAGSFEPADFVDGRLDAPANMRREVREETGIDLAGCRTESGYRLTRVGETVLLFRRYWLEQDAEEIAQRIRDHVAGDPDPEIDGPVILAHGERPAPAPPHMATLIDWHEANPLPR